MFDNWTVPPESHAIHDGFTRLTTNPYAVSRYAEVWRARFNFGESDDRPVDACIKAIKVEKVYKVATSFTLDRGNRLANIF